MRIVYDVKGNRFDGYCLFRNDRLVEKNMTTLRKALKRAADGIRADVAAATRLGKSLGRDNQYEIPETLKNFGSNLPMRRYVVIGNF